MKIELLLIFLLSFAIVSCSTQSTPTEEEVYETTDETIIDDTSDEAADEAIAESEATQDATASDYNINTVKTYTVQKNETLMMIAFKIYGDYRQWKNIRDLNHDVLKGSSNVRSGMVLKYNVPSGGEYVYSPTGNPYLIKHGDTLGIISNDVYKTKTRWKDLWNNNRDLIRDPNKIFAGFTLYYIPDAEATQEVPVTPETTQTIDETTTTNSATKVLNNDDLLLDDIVEEKYL